MWGLCRIRVLSVDVSRGEEPLHAFQVSRNRADPIIHVAAGDPLCSRGHADTIAAAIVAYHCSDRVRSVTASEDFIIVARFKSVWTAGSVGVVNRIVPVVAVVSGLGCFIPSAVLFLQRFMLPGNARV